MYLLAVQKAKEKYLVKLVKMNILCEALWLSNLARLAANWMWPLCLAGNGHLLKCVDTCYYSQSTSRLLGSANWNYG